MPPASHAAQGARIAAVTGRFQRRRGDGEDQRATALELFYDLVFVFAITQISHLLLNHLTWQGAGEAALVLLVVWWAWNCTTWVTNELDPESVVVRGLLIGIMLASLFMAVAIPDAFGGRALLFAGRTWPSRSGGTCSSPSSRRRVDRARARGAHPHLVRRLGRLLDRGRPRRLRRRVGLWLVAFAIDYCGAALPLLGAGPLASRAARRGTSRPRTSPSASRSS